MSGTVKMDFAAEAPNVQTPTHDAAYIDKEQERRVELSRTTYRHTDPLAIQGMFDCKVLRVFGAHAFWAAVMVEHRATRDAYATTSEDSSDSSGSSWSSIVEVTRGQSYRTKRVLCRLVGVDEVPDIPGMQQHVTPRTDYDDDRTKKYRARDRLIELVTDNVIVNDSSSHPLTDAQLQERLDTCNDLVLRDALTLQKGVDKWGRHLATLRSKFGTDVSRTLLDEGHVVPFETSLNDAIFSI